MKCFLCAGEGGGGYRSVPNIEILLSPERPSSLLSPFALPTPVDEPDVGGKALFLRCLRRNFKITLK